MGFPRIEQMTTSLQGLLPKPADMADSLYRLLLSTGLDALLQAAADYMNMGVEDIPEALDSRLLMRAYSGLKDSSAFLPLVTQVVEGDTTVAYAGPDKLSSVQWLDPGLTTGLNHYRRIRGWPAPGEAA